MKKSLAILGTRGIPARYGGFETFAEELAVRLAARGVDVTVYCEAGEGEQPPTHAGVKLVHIPAPPCGPLTTVLFDLRCLWHARKRFDVVYLLGYGAALFCFIPRLWGSRVWLNVDGIEWARSKWGRLARGYFRLMEAASMHTPNRVIADARAIRDHLARRHRSRIPCSVIPYGAPVVECPPDLSLLAEWGLSPQEYFLIVCRLEPENHVLEMVRGFEAASTGKRLVVVGNHLSGTRYAQELLRTRDPRISFIGTVFDREKLQALRYHAFAYCHGHSVGGTNPSLLEALGCANPVIAHDNPFNREVAGAAGLYFGDAEEFTAIVAQMEAGEVDIGALKQQGPRIIGERYTWGIIAQAYLDLLHEELQRGIFALQ
ncbi:MAG TPA: DUF1972 domain-containing protein [Geobacteraceae bacterium]